MSGHYPWHSIKKKFTPKNISEGPSWAHWSDWRWLNVLKGLGLILLGAYIQATWNVVPMLFFKLGILMCQLTGADLGLQ